MEIAQAAGHELLDKAELSSELAAFAAMLHQGSSDSQSACRAAVKWQPAGALLEQLLADITISYSPPKVGSSTVTATLNRHPAVRPEALHLHYLSQKGLANLERQVTECSHPNVRFFQEHLTYGRGGARVARGQPRATERRSVLNCP